MVPILSLSGSLREAVVGMRGGGDNVLYADLPLGKRERYPVPKVDWLLCSL